MAITVKHTKVSTIPDGDDTSVVRPSDWNADHQLVGTVPVANGGTGVSTSSGANSVVLRDANGNITTNCLFEGFSTQAASGTAIVLTASSVQNWQITGSGGQTIRLPNATTLPNGATFTFNNNQSSGTIIVQNNSSTTVATINSGGYVIVVLLDNSIAAGSWDRHDSTPSNVSWSTNTLDYAGSITSATWNGNAVAINRGGTGQTTASTAFNALSPLTTAGDTLYGGTSGAGTRLAIGTAGQVLTVNGGATAPQWSTPTTGTVTSVSGTGTVSGINLSGTVTSSGNLILGGSLDLSSPPAIGGTTPAAGTFTTITGQTEVLKGTGENLVTNSTSLATTWSPTNATVTTGQTDPFGGTNAILLTDNSTNGNHALQQQLTTTTNATTVTYSVYLKAGTANFAGLYFYQSGGGVFINLTTGAFASNLFQAPTSYAITNAGNGWWRLSITTNAYVNSASNYFQIYMATTAATNPAYAGTGSTIYISAPQFEIGSVTNTYISTTTTVVYGTPTLSFSGVAGLGLQSDGSLYVSPAGTGAIQAQATTSSTVGGNARGANAVDWQTLRGGATQVASGLASFLGAGTGNSVTGAYSINGSGGGNSATNNYSSVLGGQNNTASGVFSSECGGYQNTASGYYGTVLNGAFNSTTSNSAVTTQSATMNGTTAVTLAATNANIKVGQFITGTSINYPNTYVAAISGTSLTLSQAASGSSTSTLSFYTPHGVVVGGGNNQATGSYSFIGGGGDAGTAANRNVASGDWSVVGGGKNNTASGIASVIGGGGYYSGSSYANLASGDASFLGGGISNTVSGTGAVIVGGYSNSVNATYASILGGSFGTNRSIRGMQTTAACITPIQGLAGASQSSLLILGRQTTDATATVLTSDTNAAGTTNQVILPNNSAYYFKVSVISGVTGGGNTKAWTLEGAIKRGANAGSTAIVGTVTTTVVAADAGASTWTVTATADTTNGGLAITFTGQASTTIRTVAKCDTVEMTY